MERLVVLIGVGDVENGAKASELVSSVANNAKNEIDFMVDVLFI